MSILITLAEVLVKPVVDWFLEKIFPVIPGKENVKKDFKQYLNVLAGCFEEISSNLEAGNVPHGLGTRIKNAMMTFEAKLKKVRMPKEIRSEFESLQLRVWDTLTKGQFVDDYLGGRLLAVASKKEIKKTITEIKRTAGAIRGYADAL